jgi:predicted KAP-like P-loop ATPase
LSYETYRILLDEPASLPGLGFPAYADAFADIIATSQPRFAIGIFGGWGSGKTTLMRAIEARLNERQDIVTIWFNAWRFEHEGNMIVPLIDVLRDELSKLAESSPSLHNLCHLALLSS